MDCRFNILVIYLERTNKKGTQAWKWVGDGYVGMIHVGRHRIPFGPEKNIQW
jgi:hypothetical protein